MTVTVPRRLLVTAVNDRLDTIPNLTVYLRTVDPEPPTISDTDQRVRPYVVQHPSPGMTDDVRLGGTRNGLTWTTQLTVVAGTPDALEPVVDAITTRLDNWRPTFTGEHANTIVGRLHLLNDPGPSRRDDNESPARYWTPLIYQLTT
jgi:hypothetical protein